MYPAISDLVARAAWCFATAPFTVLPLLIDGKSDFNMYLESVQTTHQLQLPADVKNNIAATNPEVETKWQLVSNYGMVSWLPVRPVGNTVLTLMLVSLV
ncbi:hypothetical protein GGF32_003951 [Allomyces javanicus]|nr:hypothetical protein GGF32_003951 [Allomyces javanicus]